MPVSKVSIRAIVEVLASKGVDVARLGVPEIETDEALAEVWKHAIARTGRRTLPLEIGLEMPLGSMGVVDYLAASSATVGAALIVAQQVFTLVAPGVQLDIDRLARGTRRVAIVNQPPFPGQGQSDLLVLGVLLARVRQLAARPLMIRLVEMTIAPAERTAWTRLLGIDRVRLGARRTAIHLSATDWATPLRNADPRLLAMLEGLVGAEQRTSDALLVSTRALVRERLPTAARLEFLAASLGMSARSLQRRLAESGSSVSTLVDEARRARAEALIEEGLLTLGEVTSKVGFANQATLTRAFLRWRGVVPSRLRERMRVPEVRDG